MRWTFVFFSWSSSFYSVKENEQYFVIVAVRRCKSISVFVFCCSGCGLAWNGSETNAKKLPFLLDWVRQISNRLITRSKTFSDDLNSIKFFFLINRMLAAAQRLIFVKSRTDECTQRAKGRYQCTRTKVKCDTKHNLIITYLTY